MEKETRKMKLNYAKTIEKWGIPVSFEGFKHAILYPRIGGNLKYTAGKYHSIYGDVGVKWEVQGKQITLTVQIPVNTTAEIRLDQAKAVLESDGLTFTREADYMAAEAGSGTYHIAFEQ